MRIAVYGATGNIGTQVTAEAARRGHEVTALSRHEPAGPLPDGAGWQQGDVNDARAVRQVADQVDTVVSAIGPPRDPGSDPAEYATTIRGLAGAVGATRLLVVGGAGSLLDSEDRRLADRPDYPAAYRPEALAQAAALEALRATGPGSEWVYLSPAPEITDGERTGGYRVGADHPVGSWISIADFAVAVVDEVEKPAHRRERYTVATR